MLRDRRLLRLRRRCPGDQQHLGEVVLRRPRRPWLHASTGPVFVAATVLDGSRAQMGRTAASAAGEGALSPLVTTLTTKQAAAAG